MTTVHREHVALSVFFAVHCSLVALNIKGRLPYARLMSTTPTANVHHAIFNVLLAFPRRFALEVEGRYPRV